MIYHHHAYFTTPTNFPAEIGKRAIVGVSYHAQGIILDGLSNLIESAGAINIINFGLLIVLIVTVIMMFRERNNAEFRKLLLETLVIQSSENRATMSELTGELRRLFGLLIAEQKEGEESRVEFIVAMNQATNQAKEAQEHRQRQAAQLATDMADNKQAIETNTAQLMATKQELKAAQGELAMTTDELKGMKTQMDLFNVTLESMDKKLASIEVTDEGMRGAMEVLRLEVVNLRDLLNNIITMIEHGKLEESESETNSEE